MEMLPTVYLVRHATPDWSLKDIPYHLPPGPPLTSVGDKEAAEFWQRFYRTLVTTPDVAEALSATKRSYLTENGLQDNTAWAAFQLYVD